MESRVISQLRQYIIECLKPSTNIFDSFIEKCKYYYEQPAHSIKEIKLKNSTKVKGDIFENFAYMYFTCVKNWNVWFLNDIPKDLKDKLHLGKIDLGIDLIAEHEGKYYAIQVKYRKYNQKKATVLGWKQLSTFYALADRTGPWEKHIVFTNANYIRRAGMKTTKDWSICLGTLRGLKRHHWESMVGFKSQTCSEQDKKSKKILSIEEMREKRLQALSQK
jgi:hypothetical protein